MASNQLAVALAVTHAKHMRYEIATQLAEAPERDPVSAERLAYAAELSLGELLSALKKVTEVAEQARKEANERYIAAHAKMQENA